MKISILFTATVVVLALVSAISAYASPDFHIEIQKPQSRAYDYSGYDADYVNMEIAVDAGTVLDNISIRIDDGGYDDVCENCSGYDSWLMVPAGEHTLYARGVLDDETKTDSVDFSVWLEPIGLEVISPESEAYSDNDLNFLFRTDVDSTIYYILDSTYHPACEDCRVFDDDVSLDDGNHTLTVFAYQGERFESRTVNFSIQEEQDIGLDIVSPTHRTYYDSSVLFRFTTDVSSRIRYRLDSSWTTACANCTDFSDHVELENGTHTLRVRANSGNMTQTKDVVFTVRETQGNDYNRTWPYPGFENLPKLLADGEISDDELAEILENNSLPPGIINRLIKTGHLGKNSIDAILEHQFSPPGIFRRFMAFVGLAKLGYAEEIYDTYNLSDSQYEKMLFRDDLPGKKSSKIKQRLGKVVQSRIENAPQKEQDLKVFNAARQNGPAEENNAVHGNALGKQKEAPRNNGNSASAGKSNGNSLSKQKQDKAAGNGNALGKQKQDKAAGNGNAKGRALGKGR